MTKEAKIIFSITLVIIAAIIVLMITSPKQAALTAVAIPAAQLYDSTSHMTGTSTAKVTIVEFGDYQCPACGEAEPIIKQVIAEYASSSDFNFVFRNFPLPQHPNAQIAAEAAEAAGAQGKFWQMHDLLYANQNDWASSATPITFFVQYATTLGLNVTKFKSDVESSAYQNSINDDQSAGNAINVQRTPSIYINGILQSETPSFAQFQLQINALLAK